MNKLVGLLFIILIIVIYEQGNPTATATKFPTAAPTAQPSATPMAVSTPRIAVAGLLPPTQKQPPPQATPVDPGISEQTVETVADAATLLGHFAQLETKVLSGLVDGAPLEVQAFYGFFLLLREILALIGLLTVLKVRGVLRKIG